MATMFHLPSNEVEGTLRPGGQRAGADMGDPQVRTTSIASGNGQIGVWECTPGGWPIVDRATTEVCFVVSGKAKLFDEETQTTASIEAGDLLVLPQGWSGRWDITEPMRKIYVTY